MTDNLLISIEGCIASGKTTTVRMLAERLKWPVIEEDVESHPFLPWFYADPQRFSLETELGFVLLHYHQHNRAEPKVCALSDFSPVKDLVFAKTNLESQDMKLFSYLYEQLLERIPQPSFVVFLDPPISDLLARIKKRGRPYEQEIEGGYLQRIREEYEAQMASLGDSVVVLPVSHSQSIEEVFDLVQKKVTEFITSVESTQ